MFIEALAATFPFAMAIALSPFPVVGVIVVVTGTHGRRNGIHFALGWLAGMFLVTFVAAEVFAGSNDPNAAITTAANWLRVVAGTGLLLLAFVEWHHRPKPGNEPNMPGWMSNLGDTSALKTLAFGVVLALNPKNIIIAASAAAAVDQASEAGLNRDMALAVFVFLASVSVLGAVLAGLTGSTRTEFALESIRRFMVAHSTAIIIVVLAILGATILGDGISGLAA